MEVAFGGVGVVGGVGDRFICLLALAWHCPMLSSPGIQPRALLSPLGSEAAAAGLCAGQCILKVNGNNVMNDGAPEVLEHFQAFRSRREEALVSHPAAKGIREALLVGVGAEDHVPFSGEKPEGTTAFWVGWGGAAYLARLS